MLASDDTFGMGFLTPKTVCSHKVLMCNSAMLY